MASLTPLLELLFLCALRSEAKSVKDAKPDNRTRWEVIIKTCDADQSGTDARVYVKLSYQAEHTQESFALDTPGRNDFEQGRTDHYSIRTKQDDIINLGLYWWPSGTLSEGWCVDWAVLMSPERRECHVAEFFRWIRHYDDPPTYPQKLHKHLAFRDCVAPPAWTTKRGNSILPDM